MEMLQQIFMTVIVAFVLLILIAKIASAVTNGDEDDHQRRRLRDYSKVLEKDLNSKMEKTISKKKSMKRVRFAVDHEGILLNKVVAGPSETKQVVFYENHEEEMISLNDVGSVVKSPEEEFGGVETPYCDDNKRKAESLNDGVVDYDQSKEGKTELVDWESRQGTMILEENVATVTKLLSDDAIEKNDDEDMIREAPEEEIGGVEKADYDDNNQTEEGKSELIDQDTILPEQNAAAIGNKNQMCKRLLCDDGIDEAEKEKEGLISEEDDSEDDWEGVERSDLEKVFAMAADYGKEDDHLQSLGNDVQMQLYGLHKVATEGPCHEAQPMALKVSARAKWNAWQKLGNMDPDVAMEQYITLLSHNLPGWSHGISTLKSDVIGVSNSVNEDIS